MQVLLLDNYDSFTYNLYHYLRQLDASVDVLRNDQCSLDDVAKYSHILISPGPGLPDQAGLTMPILERYAKEKSILGVCLGFQAMAQWAGATLYNQEQVAHGLQRWAIRQGDSWLLKGVPNRFQLGLYHSWAVDLKGIDTFRPTAHLEKGTLMAFEHTDLPLAGVQFHPESVMTPQGLVMIENWLRR